MAAGGRALHSCARAATSVARLARSTARRVQHAAARVASAARANLDSRLHAPRAWRPRELFAAVVVVALVAAVVTAGGVLQLSRAAVAQPVAAVVRAEAPAQPQPVLVPVAAAVTVRPDAGARFVTPREARTVKPAVPVTRRPARTLNAETVRAIWRKTDTRSLDRGIAAVRTATLALHRCTVQITATDRAVAHCDVRPPATDNSPQPRKAAWTIDFRRADERWLIDDISTAAR